MDQIEEATETAPQTTVPGNEQRTATTNHPETVNRVPRHTRVSAAWTAVAIAVLLGVALIAFIVQNTQKVQIEILWGQRAHSFGSGSSRRSDNRSADRPRGGYFSDSSTPAIHSTALESNERTFSSLVMRDRHELV